MKTYKVKDQEEAVKNAKLFYEPVKLSWDLQVTCCYHDLIHMIKNASAMIYMIVTMGAVWDWEQKIKMMQMSALWQRF